MCERANQGRPASPPSLPRAVVRAWFSSPASNGAPASQPGCHEREQIPSGRTKRARHDVNVVSVVYPGADRLLGALADTLDALMAARASACRDAKQEKKHIESVRCPLHCRLPQSERRAEHNKLAGAPTAAALDEVSSTATVGCCCDLDQDCTIDRRERQSMVPGPAVDFLLRPCS